MENSALCVDTVDTISVGTLLETACSRFSDATAVVTGSEILSFSDLWSESERLAGVLRGHSVRAGDVVGIVGRRSSQVITTVIGLWTIGAIVCLIDETLPSDRRARILELSCASAVVDGSDGYAVTSVEGHGLASQSERNIDHAYIAFTSGSSGTPKAIVGSHRGLARFLTWQGSEFDLGPGDRFAHLTNLTFDVWFRDALTPIISGATLCIPSTAYLEPRSTVDFIRRERITALHVVPSVANLWSSTLDEAVGTDFLRLAFFAGEPLNGTLVSRWNQLFPRCQIVNLYGPTETTLAQHFYRVPQDPIPGVQCVGGNIAGSTTYVLDESGAECAAEVIGDVYISTEYASHGYLVDGKLESPFVSVPIAGRRLRLYATGDRGKLLRSGVLELFGRADDQVKIAGVRIELQEVRSVICEHRSVRDAFVSAHDGPLTKVLTAVVEGSSEDELSVRQFIRQRLPDTMVPTVFSFVSKLPSLPNGKVDRRHAAHIAGESVSVRFRAHAGTVVDGTVAERLERIWSRTVGGTAFLQDRTVNFFDAGGTSLLILLLHSEIQTEFTCNFPLLRLFEHGSLQKQITFLESFGTSASSAPVDHASLPSASRRRVIASRRLRKDARPKNT